MELVNTPHQPEGEAHGVISMDTWESIRLRRRAGEKIKQIARALELSPHTVRKFLRQDTPPKRIEAPRPSRLDRYQNHIDDLLRSTSKITAVRIGSYLRQNVDHELVIGQSALRAYVAKRKSIIRPKETFIRASYAPGDQAQFDFSAMHVVLAGVPTVVQLFVVRLSYSGRIFARASMRCDRPSLFAGLLAAFLCFQGVPRSAIFDNASTAVVRILRGRKRVENDAFAAFRGALALNVEFAAPAKGNEKGGVEGIHGFIEDNFFRPTPSFADLAELNAALATFCEADLARMAAGRCESIGQRFAQEAPSLHPLPAVLPRACVIESVRINKFSEVCFERNWYSVPTAYAHRPACVEIYEDRLRIIVDDVAVAEHRRAFGREQSILDPRHYLELLERKHRAAATALVLADGRIPNELRALLERYRQTDPSSASKRWVEVLALLADASAQEVAHAVTQALARGTDDPSAIALLVRQRQGALLTSKPLDSDVLPMRARVLAPIVDLQAYATAKLMEGVA
jgi:transposase